MFYRAIMGIYANQFQKKPYSECEFNLKNKKNVWQPLMNSFCLTCVFCREPEMKRTICKRCGLILKPGISADFNINSEQNDKIKVCETKCMQCGSIKRFVLNKNYKLWLDDKQSIKEVVRPNEGGHVKKG